MFIFNTIFKSFAPTLPFGLPTLRYPGILVCLISALPSRGATLLYPAMCAVYSLKDKLATLYRDALNYSELAEDGLVARNGTLRKRPRNIECRPFVGNLIAHFVCLPRIVQCFEFLWITCL